MEGIKVGEGRFYMGGYEDPLAEILYEDDGENIAITHTYVSETLRGRGIARQLVLEVVGLARREGKKIIPLCTYAKKMLEGDNGFQDVLFK